MADDQSSSSGSGGSRKPAGRGKRKPVTIDLTATQVPTGTGADPEPAATPAASGRSSGTSVPASGKATASASSETGADPAAADAKSAADDAAPQDKPAPDAAAPESSQPQDPAIKAEPSQSPSGAALGSDGYKGSDRPEIPAESATDEKPELSAKTEEEHPAETAPIPDKPVTDKPAPTKPAKRGVGLFGLLVASLAGGLIVVGVLYGLLFYNMLPIGSRAELNALNDSLNDARNEISILETRLVEAEEVTAENARSVGDAGALTERLDAAEDTLARLESADQTTGETLQAASAALEDLKRARTADAEAASSFDARQKSLVARIDGLEQSTGAGTRNLGKVARDLAETGQRLDRVEALQSDLLDLRKLVETGSAGSDVALESLEKSLGGLRDRVDALAKASSTAVIDARLAALEASSGGIDVVARRLGTLQADVDTMNTRVDQAVKSISPEAPQIETAIARALANLEPRFSALSSDIAATSMEIAGLRQQAAEAQSQWNAGNQDLSKALADQSGTLLARLNTLDETTQGLDARISGLATELTTLESKVNTPGALDQAALALSVTRLKDAVDGGRSFQVELAAVESLAGDKTDLSALRDRAASGIAEKSALIAAFPATARAMRTALEEAEKPAGETPAAADPLDQVLTSLQSLVRIKSRDEADPGLPGAAALAAMTKAVNAADLKAALAAWETLPETAKAASRTWAGDVKARLAVDAVVEKVVAEIVSTVSNSTN